MKHGNDGLRGEAAPEGQAVACQACGLPPISAGLPPLKTCQCARLVMRPQPAAPAPVAGWLQAVDTELVNAHLGVANSDDDFEAARRKLSELIQWHIDVSHDPRVNGAPVAGDAVWSDEAAHAFRSAADAVGAQWHSWPDRFRAGMKAALAQDRASQAGAAVPDGWRLVPVEPSGVMLMAGHRAGGHSVSCGGIYAAMLAAAPTPAAEREVRRG